MTGHLAWMQRLPSGWRVKPLRAVSDYVVSNVDKTPVDGELPVRLCNYSDVYNNEFISLRLDFMACTATEDEICKFGLLVDDVIITKDSESWDDIGIPALVVETAEDLVCGYHLALLRPHQAALSGRFLLRCLQAKVLRLQLELAANGVTRFGLPKSDIGAMRLPVPPLESQLAIADFLDRETARIDALIGAKQRVLDLLAEKRKAIIAAAVTRGLDPNVKLRDSGVPWLGEIPAHWEAMRVRHLGTLRGGAGFPHEHQGSLEGEIPFFKVKDLGETDAPMLATNNYISPETAAELRAHVFSSKAVVFAKVGAALLLNRFRVLGVPGCIDNNMMGLSLNEERISVEFGLSALSLLDFKIVANPGAVPSVNEGQVSEYRLPVPPLDEQHAIVAHIARETAKLDAVRAATERTIALLKERRSALIAAAVTGQLDVGAAA